LRITYERDVFGLLNPFALLCGLVSCVMLVMHGGVYLAIKADQPVADRATKMARGAAFVLLALFALCGVFAGHGIDGYKVTSNLIHDGPSNPLLKTQRRLAFELQRLAHGCCLPRVGFRRRDNDERFAAGAAKRICIDRERRGGRRRVIATAGFSSFPFLLPSSLEPNASLTVWDASSTRSTLLVILAATLVFLPLVLAYTALVYRVLRGRVTMAHVEENKSTIY
jgi:cytochrome d ubiquinol oxidase subunit II